MNNNESLLLTPDLVCHIQRLHREYYFNLVEETRVEALNKLGLSNVGEERVQCWGSN